MIFLFTIIILSAVEFVGDSNLKKFAKNPKKVNNLIVGIVAYTIVIKLLINALKQRNIIFTNAMWDSVSTLLETGLAILILHESLKNVYQWTGLFLTFIGIMLLNFGKNN